MLRRVDKAPVVGEEETDRCVQILKTLKKTHFHTPLFDSLFIKHFDQKISIITGTSVPLVNGRFKE